MGEWWTYRPADFLMFSPQTYYRLFELYNTEVWPMQILTLALGVGLLVLVKHNSPWQGRVISAILTVIWLWVAWAYHLQRYATINWAANYFAVGFAFEAVLLVWFGVIKGKLVFRAATYMPNVAGLVIFIFALAIHPFIGPLVGRDWLQTEFFGIAPDPTAIATLGIFLLTSNRLHWILSTIPILWCIISGTILFTMGSSDALATPLAACLILALMLRKPTSTQTK